MANYTCTGCGVGECNVGVSGDEMDPVQFMSRFKCTVWGDECTQLELEDSEGHHRDKNTGIPLGTKDGKCVIDWEPCDQPALSDACRICQKVRKLQDSSDAFTVGQEVWYICKDAMEILRSTNGSMPQFDQEDYNILHRGYVKFVDGEDVTITLETYMNEPSNRKEMRIKGWGAKQIVCKESDVFCTPEQAIAAFVSKTESDLMKQMEWFDKEQERNIIESDLTAEDVRKREEAEAKDKCGSCENFSPELYDDAKGWCKSASRNQSEENTLPMPEKYAKDKCDCGDWSKKSED